MRISTLLIIKEAVLSATEWKGRPIVPQCPKDVSKVPVTVKKTNQGRHVYVSICISNGHP